ncbi:putative zinc finger protein [Rosellinia necatrix]|uniref:Putative zinc finger protein n=1 Tax=Rosellinia necatrix TaxID=77044 RepID=A0A1S8A7Q3_ROSNE|nr:putative zinc finger protein [Rosellinia necatrix]
MYSAFDENAMQHATGFLQSAEQLWMTQQSSCLSMAGAVLLSISLMGNGKDHAVLRYATDALEMGRQLGLFHDNTGPSGNVYESGADISGDELRARSYAAWGVFNWNV